MSLEDNAHAIGQLVGGAAEEGTETLSSKRFQIPKNTTVCDPNLLRYDFFKFF